MNAVLFPILLILWVLSMYRNVRVFQFRRRLLDLVHSANQRDIANHDFRKNPFIELNWRYKVLESVTYSDMMLRFWVPLKVQYWYEDDFLK